MLQNIVALYTFPRNIWFCPFSPSLSVWNVNQVFKISLLLFPLSFFPGYYLFMFVDTLGFFFCAVLSHFSCVWLFATLCTIAHQAPLSMGFSRQESWSGLLGPPPGDLPEPGTEPMSLPAPALQEDSLLLSHWVELFNFNDYYCPNSR